MMSEEKEGVRWRKVLSWALLWQRRGLRPAMAREGVCGGGASPQAQPRQNERGGSCWFLLKASIKINLGRQ